MDSTSQKPNVPSLNLEKFIGAISNVARWRMLRELSQGETRETAELMNVAGCSYDSALKHLSILQQAGLISRGRGKLYQIEKQFLASPTERILDYGYCLLRLDMVK